MRQSLADIWNLRASISLSHKIIPILFGFKRSKLPKWKWSIFWGGHIRNLFDKDINSTVKEISGPWTSSVCITCPADPCETLDIYLPLLEIIVKNLNGGFAFEAQLLDNKNVKREIYATTNRSMAHWSLYRCCLPLQLDDGWNKITLDLAYYTKLLFKSKYVKALCVKVYANCRLRQIYFADRIYDNQELPDGYMVHLPVCGANTSIFTRRTSEQL